MKRIRIIIPTLTLLVSVTNISAQEINIRKIDDYLTHVGQNNLDIGNVSIFKNGKEIYNRGFGQQKGVKFNDYAGNCIPLLPG